MTQRTTLAALAGSAALIGSLAIAVPAHASVSTTPHASAGVSAVSGSASPFSSVISSMRTAASFERVALAQAKKTKGKVVTVRGTVRRIAGPSAKNVKVELWRVGKRGQVRHVATRAVSSNGSYSIPVRLGNRKSIQQRTFRLKFAGLDNSNTRRSWWWRGTNGRFVGGVPHQNEASKFRIGTGGFRADFSYGQVTGKVTNAKGKAVGGREVTVFARPVRWPKSAKVMREMDIASCANVMSSVRTNSSGTYVANFIPTHGSQRRLIVKADGSLWNGIDGTCHRAVRYRKDATSTPGLGTLGSAGTWTKNLRVGQQGRKVAIRASFPGYSPTAAGDKWITIREYAPGRKILASDVIRAGSTSRLKSVRLPRGHYWVEVGRRTGCNAWYPSRFPNNYGYHNGLDRGFERWMTVSGKYPEYKKSYSMGYKAKNPPKGATGWMYRQHCRANGAGTYKRIAVNSNSGSQTVALTSRKGGVVRGKVTSAKVKPRIELMVRLTSSNGKNIYRTAMTNGAGRFTIYGVPSGTYRVVVNADSWRGISRKFAGKKKIKVKAGRTQSLGTLRFVQ